MSIDGTEDGYVVTVVVGGLANLGYQSFAKGRVVWEGVVLVEGPPCGGLAFCIAPVKDVDGLDGLVFSGVERAWGWTGGACRDWPGKGAGRVGGRPKRAGVERSGYHGFWETADRRTYAFRPRTRKQLQTARSTVQRRRPAPITPSTHSPLVSHW